MWRELLWYSHGPTCLPPVQNLFQDFVAGLNVEGQNPFLLHYLAQAFIDDYAYPAKACRYIRLKISICVQVIGVACFNGKCLIRRSFTQETRKQPFSEINQILQEEHVFFSYHTCWYAGGHPDRGCHCTGWQRWHNCNLKSRLDLQIRFSALHLPSRLTQAI